MSGVVGNSRMILPIEGEKYGDWTVTGKLKRIGKIYHWECVCKCGEEKWVNNGNLRRGLSKGCANTCPSKSRRTPEEIAQNSAAWWQKERPNTGMTNAQWWSKKRRDITAVRKEKRLVAKMKELGFETKEELLESQRKAKKSRYLHNAKLMRLLKHPSTIWLEKRSHVDRSIFNGMETITGGKRTLVVNGGRNIVSLPISGEEYGDWTVTGEYERRSESGLYYWECVCKCGEKRWVIGMSLKKGRSKCCGASCPKKPRLTPEELAQKRKLYREKQGEKLKAKKREHYRKNSDYYKSQSMKRRARQKAENPNYLEEQRSYSKEYYRNNPEKIKGAQKRKRERMGDKEWRARYNAYANKRRGIELDAILPSSDLELIADFWRQRQEIDEETGAKHHVDHIIPLSIGGAHHQDNLRILTAKENMMKSARYDPKLGGVWADSELAKETRRKLGI